MILKQVQEFNRVLKFGRRNYMDWSRMHFSQKTGLNMDYPNEYLFLPSHNLEEIIEILKRKPIKRYMERRSSEGTEITPEREKAVVEIDQLASELNSSALNGTLTMLRVRQVVTRMNFLIYGK